MEKIKIICKCKNCGKEFVAQEISESEFNKVQPTTIWFHQCQGKKSVLGVGRPVRFELPKSMEK